MKKEHTIALCTIVKNEERFIGKCLASVQGAVDEIVIVDTGSTDKTGEIAEKFGAKVYHHPWQDSFSEARNYGLQFVTSQWVLVLDADEELERADIGLLRKVVQASHVTNFFVPVINYLPEGNISRLYSRRLFRKGRGHYEGIVHNQLVVSGPSGQAEIRVYHHGYNLSAEEMAAKHARSERLLLKQIREEPTNPFPRFNLGRIYRNQGRYAQAAEVDKEGLELCPPGSKHSTYFMLLFDLAYSLMMMGRLAEAEAYCTQGLADDPKNIDLRFTLAAIYARQKRFEEAIKEYQRFLAILARSKKEPQFNFTTVIVDSWAFEDRALYHIGQCYLAMGKSEEAETFYEGLLWEKRHALFFKGLAQCKQVRRDLEGARQVLEQAVAEGCDDPLVHLQLGEVWRELGHVENSLRCLAQASKMAPTNVDILNSYAHALMGVGEYATAIDLLRQASEQAPTHVGVQVGLLRGSIIMGRLTEASVAVERLRGSEISDAETNCEVGDACVRLKLYAQAIEFYEKAVLLAPQEVRILANIATCYAQLGHIDAARLGYQAALALDPAYELARRNLAVLERVGAEMTT